MRKYRFYKEVAEDGSREWYIDMPLWSFLGLPKYMLEMVGKADEILDNLTEGSEVVTLQVSTSPIPFATGKLTKLFCDFWSGAIYKSEKGYTNTDAVELDIEEVYLCPTTMLVFWKYPKTIYYKVLENE